MDQTNQIETPADDPRVDAQRLLASLTVINVLVADGQLIGVQLPAARHTAESLTDIQSALTQAAVNVGQIARQARARTPAA